MNAQPQLEYSDHELLGLIAQHNQEAISVLYDRYATILNTVILTIVKDSKESEDTLQEVFVLIWRRASTYQPSLGSPRTWMVRLARNKAIDVLRSKRFQQNRSNAFSIDEEEGYQLPLEYTTNTTWDDTIHTEHMGVLTHALYQLPSEQRNMIDLAFFQGYTHQEIADLTCTPLGTIKTRIRSGMQALRSRLQYLAEDLN